MKTTKPIQSARAKWLVCLLFAVSLIVLFFIQPLLPSKAAQIVVSNIFFAEIIIALFAAAIFLAGRWMRELGFSGEAKMIIGASVVVLLEVGALFFYFFYSGEKDIRVYDFSAYWINVLRMREVARDSLSSFFSQTMNSLPNDYTYLATIPLIPLSYLFGTQYFGYVLSVFVVYYVPACFFLTLFAMRIMKMYRNERPSVVAFIACLAMGVICPSMLWPVMNGYIDAVGVLLMALLMNVTLHWMGERFSWKHIFTLSILNLLLILSRRWYVFYLIGFYVSLAVGVLLSIIRKRVTYSALKHLLLNV